MVFTKAAPAFFTRGYIHEFCWESLCKLSLLRNRKFDLRVHKANFSLPNSNNRGNSYRLLSIPAT